MQSIIFATLKGGEYNDYWMSDLNTLLADDTRAGYRELHWCGQPTRTEGEAIVGPGTWVAVRPDIKKKEFTLVGRVCEKSLITERKYKQPATYRLLVDMHVESKRIPKAPEDRYTHWTVLREVGIRRNGSGVAEGIYWS